MSHPRWFVASDTVPQYPTLTPRGRDRSLRLSERLSHRLRCLRDVKQCLLISFRRFERSCCLRLQETSIPRSCWTTGPLKMKALRFLETSGIDHPTTRVTHERRPRKVPDSFPAVPERRNDQCYVHSILALDRTCTT